MPKCYIFIVPPGPVFNAGEVQTFENLSQGDSSLLQSTLYLNYKDMLSKGPNGYEVIYFFDEKDKDCIPADFEAEGIKKQFIRCAEGWSCIANFISQKINQDSTNILILFSHTIGISPQKIEKYFNLLNHEDRNMLIGRTSSQMVSLIGVNYFEGRMFDGLTSCYLRLEEFLKYVNRLDNFLFIVDGFNAVEKLDDFRKLYKVLSTKESIEFCSHEIYEQFTHLFIEYKELL
ncbi:MAG: hypothetical protein HF314_18680 [Ignavibacteria bacterium]|jgi:hypothetical protein|nr:hypothetical protein [Ignavibacteria bacterium]MCU7505115.1 hypothetical protein [Ignavibacteria bacterium]MCU7517510.1 hypothetical protein [Ignavibacteria bacterium]